MSIEQVDLSASDLDRPPVRDQLSPVALDVLRDVSERYAGGGSDLLVAVALEAQQDVPPNADDAVARFVIEAAVNNEIENLRDAGAAVVRISAILRARETE